MEHGSDGAWLPSYTTFPPQFNPPPSPNLISQVTHTPIPSTAGETPAPLLHVPASPTTPRPQQTEPQPNPHSGMQIPTLCNISTGKRCSRSSQAHTHAASRRNCTHGRHQRHRPERAQTRCQEEKQPLPAQSRRRRRRRAPLPHVTAAAALTPAPARSAR